MGEILARNIQVQLPSVLSACLFVIMCAFLMSLLCWHSQVRRRTANQNSGYGSHVMQYGDLKLSVENLFLYMGTNPANDNHSFVGNNALQLSSKAVNQRDADLLHFWNKVCVTPFSTRLNQLHDLIIMCVFFIHWYHLEVILNYNKRSLSCSLQVKFERQIQC